MKVGYLRNSSSIEDTDVLLSNLESQGCDRVFVGSTAESPKRDGILSALALRLNRGDTLIVSTFESVAGSLPQFIEFVASLCRRGVVFESLEEKFSTSKKSTGPALATVFEQLSHYKFSNNDFLADGVHKSRVRAGRPKLLSDDDADRAHFLVNVEGKSVKGVADEMGVSRATIYRYLGHS